MVIFIECMLAQYEVHNRTLTLVYSENFQVLREVWTHDPWRKPLTVPLGHVRPPINNQSINLVVNYNLYLYFVFYLLQVLDKMILYLRIVHSVDYYSANEYPNEDEMPHRCGIMHARGPSPSTKITETEGIHCQITWNYVKIS